MLLIINSNPSTCLTPIKFLLCINVKNTFLFIPLSPLNSYLHVLMSLLSCLLPSYIPLNRLICPSHCFFLGFLGWHPFSFSPNASIGFSAKSWHRFGDLAVLSFISLPCLSHHIPFPMRKKQQYRQYCVIPSPPICLPSLPALSARSSSTGLPAALS